MSKKPSRIRGSASSEIIRKAATNLKKMPQERMIDLIVEMGSLTPDQGERAKKKWAELQAAKASA